MEVREKWLIVASFVAAAAVVVAETGAGPLSETFVNWADHPAIQYHTRPTTDPVAELNRKVSRYTMSIGFQGLFTR